MAALPPAGATTARFRPAAPGEPRLYASSMLVSRRDDAVFSFVRGVAAARVRFSPLPGQHGAFWLQSDERRDTEIDVIESYGRGRRASAGLHVRRRDGSTRPLQQRFGGRFPTGADDDWYRLFHTFSVEWTRTEYVFRVDGEEVLRLDQHVSDTPHFVLLSHFVSDWEVGENSGAEASMEVDWVRVWQDPADPATGAGTLPPGPG